MALAAANFRKLRESGNIVESPLECPTQDHLEHGGDSSCSLGFAMWRFAPIYLFKCNKIRDLNFEPMKSLAREEASCARAHADYRVGGTGSDGRAGVGGP
jgi:hypothetical protein